MSNKLTADMRAARLKVLSSLAPEDVAPAPNNTWRLSYPAPRGEQFSIVNQLTGDVRKHVHQAGTEVRAVLNPQLYLATIDRRISYLWTMHKHKTKLDLVYDWQARQFMTRLTPTPSPEPSEPIATLLLVIVAYVVTEWL